MQAHGRLKKWLVDNKIDKEGDPVPTIVMTIEIPFMAYRAKDLADLTTGDVLNINVDKTQMDVPYETVKNEEDPKKEQPTLALAEGPGEAEADTEPTDPEDTEPEDGQDQAAEA